MILEVATETTATTSPIPFTTVVVALIALTGVILQVWRASKSEHDRLEQDLRIMNALPDDSAIRSEMLTSIEVRVKAALQPDSKRRDPLGMFLAITFLAVAFFLGWQISNTEGAWRAALWIPCIFFGLFGIVGLVQDGIKRERDDRGKAIRQASTK